MKIEAKLKQLMELKAGTVKAFAELINLPYTTIRSILERGVLNAKVENVIKICNGLGILPEEVMTLEEKSTASISTNEIINKTVGNIEKLKPDRQKKVYDFSEAQLREQNKIVSIETYQEEVQATLSAGKGIMNYYEADKEIVDIPHNAPDHDWIFKVKGDSMEPMFEDGDIVFANEFDPATEDIQNGRIYVIEIDGEAFIKKVYVENDCLRLVSLNREYEDITVHASSLINVVAVVIL